MAQDSTKCIIPSSLRYWQMAVMHQSVIEDVYKPGTIVAVAIHCSEYLCKIVPQTCDSVSIVSDAVLLPGTKVPSSGLQIRPIKETVREIETLELDVCIDHHCPLFDSGSGLELEILQTIVRSICETLILINGCTVNLGGYPAYEEWGVCSLGNVKTGYSNETPTRITPSSQILIRNVSLKNRFCEPTLDSLAGVGDIIESIQKDCQRGMNTLLIGPSGSGKTSIVHSVTRGLSANLQKLEPLNGTKGTSESPFSRQVDQIIALSQILTGPTIVLIENIDGFCQKKEKSVEYHILDAIDRFRMCNSEIIVICTTRHIDQVDSKFRRPGRLDQEVYLRAPNEVERIQILSAMVEKSQILSKDQIAFIAKKTPAFLGGDLKSLLNKAFLIGQETGNAITQKDIENALPKVRPVNLSANSFLVPSDALMEFSSLGGLEGVKKTLENILFRPLVHPESYLRFNLSLPKGILLYGPPGCAKTTIVKCLANELNRHLVVVSAAQIYSPYVGESEKILAHVFQQARVCAPSILFIDEIDAIVGSRSTSQSGRNDVQAKLLSTLLIEMDGVGLKVQTNVSSGKHILVVGATNRPDMIDEALKRPGRFDRLVYIPAPNPQERTNILQLVSRKMPVHEDVDFQRLGNLTKLFSGADLISLCNETALETVVHDPDMTQLKMEHFMSTFAKFKPSLTAKQIQWYDQFHEGTDN